MGCERVNEWSRSETHGNYGEMRKSMSHIMWEILLGLGHGFRLATGRCLSRHSPSFLLNGLTIWPTSFVSPAWLGMAQNHRELRATMDIWRIMRCVLKTAIPMSDGPRLVFFGLLMCCNFKVVQPERNIQRQYTWCLCNFQCHSHDLHG